MANRQTDKFVGNKKSSFFTGQTVNFTFILRLLRAQKVHQALQQLRGGVRLVRGHVRRDAAAEHVEVQEQGLPQVSGL